MESKRDSLSQGERVGVRGASISQLSTYLTRTAKRSGLSHRERPRVSMSVDHTLIDRTASEDHGQAKAKRTAQESRRSPMSWLRGSAFVPGEESLDCARGILRLLFLGHVPAIGKNDQLRRGNIGL